MPATGAFPADSATLTPRLRGPPSSSRSTIARGAARDLMLVSRVQGQDVAPGQRVAFFRRYQRDGGPVSVLGEGVVQSVGERTYLVQIVGSRDAIEQATWWDQPVVARLTPAWRCARRNPWRVVA